MGFFFRKSFRFGPARINLSKSGVGISAGTKGARLGIGTRGAYITAGLKGIYYRKRLGGAARDSGESESELSVAAVIVTWLVIVASGAILGVMLWFVAVLLFRT